MKTADEFINLLQLTDKKFGNTPLNGIIMNVYNFVAEIWQNTRLYNFVEHGIEHSYKVIEKALCIYEIITLTNLDLTPLERTVLGIAGLIHDIGMQYNKYPENNKLLTDEEIRENHSELGFGMIIDTINGNFTSQRSGPIFNLEEYHKMFLHYGALVGFAHNGMKYWELLKQQQYDESKPGNLQRLRLRLLAALHRFADELHCEYTRIPEFNLLYSAQLSAENKAHWSACYYTDDIRFSSPRTGGGLRITLKWRVPESSTDNEINIINALLTDLRERKINQEKELIKNYLKLDDTSEPSIIEFLIDPNPITLPIQKPPPEVEKYVKEILRPYQFGVKTQFAVAGASELPSSPNVDDLKYRAHRFISWHKGMVSGHYRLKTGWHTNKYFRCRELCSEQYFSLDLSKELAKLYEETKFTDVLAIGTSAIEIANILALTLGIKFNYTFRNVQIRDTEINKVNYTDYEMQASPTESARLLIIDDILGMGSVVSNVLTQLQENLAKPPKYIRIFTIFMLGSEREFIAKLPKFAPVVIDYLLAVPDVIYYKEDATTQICEICRDNPGITITEEY